MTVVESIPYALFTMFIVFVVLICLSVIIKILSFIIGFVIGNVKKNPDIASAPISVAAAENIQEMSGGELKLINVDERTAAMIMAIVCDQSGIPLDELCFKSIKAKD